MEINSKYTVFSMFPKKGEITLHSLSFFHWHIASQSFSFPSSSSNNYLIRNRFANAVSR